MTELEERFNGLVMSLDNEIRRLHKRLDHVEVTHNLRLDKLEDAIEKKSSSAELNVVKSKPTDPVP